jgi:hypothetical protein
LYEFIFTSHTHTHTHKKGGSICKMEFQVKLTENLISKYHVTEESPLGIAPKTVPPTRMNASQYPSDIAATVSKHNPCRHCLMCYKKRQRHETR